MAKRQTKRRTKRRSKKLNRRTRKTKARPPRLYRDAESGKYFIRKNNKRIYLGDSSNNAQQMVRVIINNILTRQQGRKKRKKKSKSNSKTDDSSDNSATANPTSLLHFSPAQAAAYQRYSAYQLLDRSSDDNTATTLANNQLKLIKQQEEKIKQLEDKTNELKQVQNKRAPGFDQSDILGIMRDELEDRFIRRGNRRGRTRRTHFNQGEDDSSSDRSTPRSRLPTLPPPAYTSEGIQRMSKVNRRDSINDDDLRELQASLIDGTSDGEVTEVDSKVESKVESKERKERKVESKERKEPERKVESKEREVERKVESKEPERKEITISPTTTRLQLNRPPRQRPGELKEEFENRVDYYNEVVTKLQKVDLVKLLGVPRTRKQKKGLVQDVLNNSQARQLLDDYRFNGWDSDKVLTGVRRRQAIKRLLSPIIPRSRFGRGENDGSIDISEGMYDSQINGVMKGYKNRGYLGVISKDEIKSKIVPAAKRYLKWFDDTDQDGGRVISFVMNLDTSDKPGSHWVGVFISADDDKSLEYFDSFARQPPESFMYDIQPVINLFDLPYYMKFKVNKIQTQDDDTSTCGFHVITFLKGRYAGNPFKECSGYDDSSRGERIVRGNMKKFGFI